MRFQIPQWLSVAMLLLAGCTPEFNATQSGLLTAPSPSPSPSASAEVEVQVSTSVAAAAPVTTTTIANVIPTLTTITTLTGGVQDTPYTISYTALAAAANESDAEGAAISFRVEGISTGTLTKGGVAVSAGSTLLSSGESFVWTGALGASGSALNAFTVKAYDGKDSSSTAIQVKVDVTANNVPTLTSISTLAGGTEDTALTITYAALAAAANEADADADAISFRVEAVSTGTLTKGGTAVVAGTDTLASGEQLVWTPASNANGTGGSAVSAFTVKAIDARNGLSASAVQVKVDVAAVNDAPTLTTLSNFSTNEDTALTITYADLQGAANEADVDTGATVNFKIMSLTTGTLTYSGGAISYGTTVIAAGESVVWTPAANENVSTNSSAAFNAFKIRAHDGTTDNGADLQLKVDVAAVNDNPTIPAISDPTPIALGSTTISGIAFTFDEGGSTDENSQTVTLAATSSNTTLLPSASIVISNATDTNAISASTLTPTIGVTFAAGITGRSTVTITATDNGTGTLTGTQTFIVEVLFPCDSGTLATTCNVSTTRNMVNGSQIIGAGNLVVQNVGVINTNATESISIAMGGDITIQSGGKITANLSNASATNFTVDLGGEIGVYRKGHAGGTARGDGVGTGKGIGSTAAFQVPGGGGGHGGAGGAGSDPTNGAAGGGTYGSATAPVTFGSGGGAGYNAAGGAGGGAIKINVTGTITVNGRIDADGDGTSGASGTADRGGGGAGGSIWLIATTLTGTSGAITAKGGVGAAKTSYPIVNEQAGSGGGGRIAVHVTNYAYSGSVNVSGGEHTGMPNSNKGAGGSFDLGASTVVCDAGNLAGTCTLTSNRTLPGGYNLSGVNFVFGSGGKISNAASDQPTTLTASGNVNTQSGASIDANLNFVVGGTLTLETGSTVAGNSTFTAATMVVQSGASLNANSKGFKGGVYSSAGMGPGSGAASEALTAPGGGGGHGGAGGAGSHPTNGAAGGGTYGDATAPITWGSGGGSGSAIGGTAGGGAIKVNVSGTLTVNGTISADGQGGGYTGTPNKGGGGAGGSVWVIAGTINGASTGVISAKGGAGGTYANDAINNGGGGGGGRVAIHATNYAYGGSVNILGGDSSVNAHNTGASGTFDLGSSGFVCDSGNLATTCTLTSARALPAGYNLSGADFVFGSGGKLSNAATDQTATLTASGDVTFQNGASMDANFTFTVTGTLTLQTGSAVAGNSTYTAATMVVQTGATLHANYKGFKGGWISNNGSGPGGGTGPGILTIPGGGGGHGGVGGAGSDPTNPTAGGSTYGSASAPVTWGSGGGGGYNSAGGQGGGAIKITVSGTLTVDGTISANGNSMGLYSMADRLGAGAGGSVWIIANALNGISTGVISATGGVASTCSGCYEDDDNSGGGGGGRVALNITTGYTYGGTVNVSGGDSITASRNFGAGGSFDLGSTAFVCDAGDLTSTCTLTSRRTLPSGYNLSGVNFVFGPGGKLANAALDQPATLIASGNVTFQNTVSMDANLTYAVTGTLTLQTGSTVAGNSTFTAGTMTVETGAVLHANYKGFVGGWVNKHGAGPGGGRGSAAQTIPSGGGGHAGAGGAGSDPVTPAAGGGTYGNSAAPTTWGSGGGGSAANAAGGSGGGAIKVTVTGVLTVDGTISANGTSMVAWTNADRPAGGAGGSVWLITDTLAGAGTISAAGGTGSSTNVGGNDDHGGGGGGGYVRREANTNNFVGTISVAGGTVAGGNAGAAGLITP